MNLEVTQKNLYLLLPSKLSYMVEMLVEDTKIEPIEAIKKLYLSETYSRLEQESTKMWHLGPVALYQDYLENELNHRQKQP